MRNKTCNVNNSLKTKRTWGVRANVEATLPKTGTTYNEDEARPSKAEAS